MRLLRLVLRLLLVSAQCWPVCTSAWDEDVMEQPGVLRHVLEAEIHATKQQLGLYQRKAELLTDALKRLETQRQLKAMNNASTTEQFGSGAAASHQRRSRSPESPQIFSHWFAPKRAFSPASSSRRLTQMISFRSNASPTGRKQQMTARRRAALEDEPPLQYLLVLHTHSTLLQLFHPTTFEVMWQYSLDLRSSSHDGAFRVADMYFVSDRSAHLAILSTSGDLALFKLRLWHYRRVVAGDPRRVKPLKELEENQLQCAAGQDSIDALEASPFPWRQQSSATLTSPAPGKYLHVDVDRVFRTTAGQTRQYDRGKVAVVALYNRVLVVTSDSAGGVVSLYYGDNGSFVEDVRTPIGPHDGGVVQLEPIQSSRGLVALATRSRVFLIDATVSQLLPVACEAPGRHKFTSTAADPLRPSIMYAGTSTGRAFVFKLHNLASWRQRSDLSEHEAPGPILCTLADQLLPHRPPAPPLGHETPSVVQTMPGFLVLGAGSRLVLYKLSGSSGDVHPVYLSERSLVASFAQELERTSQRPTILAVSTAKDLVAHTVGLAVLVAANQSHRLHIYESRIPPPGTNLDLSWVRVPAMMICALVAMFWQQRARLANAPGGPSAFNEAELAGLISGRGGRLTSMNSTKRGSLTSNRRASDWY